MEEAKRILIIGKDILLVQSMRQMLSRAGYEVSGVHTGAAGIEKATKTSFDLVLSDARMPDMTGFEICRTIKKQPDGDRTTVVLVSGGPTTEDYQQAHDAGAAQYLAKPLELGSFLSLLAMHGKSCRKSLAA